jgi:hypothetical protein
MEVAEIALYFDTRGLSELPSILDKIGEVIEAYS